MATFFKKTASMAEDKIKKQVTVDINTDDGLKVQPEGLG
jgi:hypothetical protein